MLRSQQQQALPGATLHCWRLQLLVSNATAASLDWQRSRRACLTHLLTQCLTGALAPHQERPKARPGNCWELTSA